MDVVWLDSCRFPANPSLFSLNKQPVSGPSRVGLAARKGGAFPRLAAAAAMKVEKPEVCTADELHYVWAENSEWKLALWRYLPSPKAPKRNRPLLLLSGIATNAIGFDLSPESSFSRFMCGQGFDTWVLEMRGAGLSELGVEHEEGQFSAIGSQIKDVSQKLLNIIDVGQQPIKLPFFDIQENLSTTLEDSLKQLDLLPKYNWDFDHFLEDDLPAVIEYVRTVCKPKDGKLFAIGHSMGGILLYALLSRCSFEGRDSGLTSVATLSSTLDYSSSRSSLKMFLPAADPAKALNIPALPVGTLLAAALPLASRPPYILYGLNLLISAPGMLHPNLMEKLILNNFCTVPTKLLLQLTTAFQEGGLQDRSGSFFYKSHLNKSNVPVLAVAADQDLICPLEAVYETVKVIPEHLVTFRVFGEPNGPHYGHYDLVGGRLAIEQVYPCLIDFLNQHDIIH